MTDHDKFFMGRKPAAVLKHHVLKEYFTVFARMVGKGWSGHPIWLIDAYAGPGMYAAEEHADEVPGSPVVAMGIAEQMRGKADVRCAFIEQNSRFAADLKRNIQPFVDAGLLGHVYPGEVANELPKAWAMIGAEPVVTFLDPFGVAMPRAMMTSILLQRAKPPAEVMLNISVAAVGRLGGNLELRDGQVVAKPGQEKGVKKADEFLGGDWWRARFLDARVSDGSAARAAEAVVSQYCGQVERETGTHSMSIPVRRRPDHPVLFYLTLFYRHEAAGYKFADAASRATRKWRDAYREQELAEDLAADAPTLFDAEPLVRVTRAKDAEEQEKTLQSEWIAQVADNIRSGLAGRGSLALARDIRVILGRTLSLAGETEIRKAWDILADEGTTVPRDKAQRSFWKQTIIKRTK